MIMITINANLLRARQLSIPGYFLAHAFHVIDMNRIFPKRSPSCDVVSLPSTLIELASSQRLYIRSILQHQPASPKGFHVEKPKVYLFSIYM